MTCGLGGGTHRFTSHVVPAGPSFSTIPFASSSSRMRVGFLEVLRFARGVTGGDLRINLFHSNGWLAFD